MQDASFLTTKGVDIDARAIPLAGGFWELGMFAALLCYCMPERSAHGVTNARSTHAAEQSFIASSAHRFLAEAVLGFISFIVADNRFDAARKWGCAAS